MIELIQFPWSPFCIVQRQLLEFSGARFKTTNLKLTGDRSFIWKLTKGRYYAAPVLKDGRNIIFETSEDSQVISKYLDQKLKLGLFPAELEGEQSILWRYIENDIEELTFKLNDAHFREFVSKSDQLSYIRHKERKFGRGCIDQWRAQQKLMQSQLATRLLPFEEMLSYRPFLLGDRPRFVDFDLYGMLGNFLFRDTTSFPQTAHRYQSGNVVWHLPSFLNSQREELHTRYQRPPPRSQFTPQFSGQQRPDSHRSHRGN